MLRPQMDAGFEIEGQSIDAGEQEAQRHRR
jgi:hypothetical protein